MNRYLLGIATGITIALAARTAAIACLTAIVRHAEMAEERTWTQIDEGLHLHFDSVDEDVQAIIRSASAGL